MTMSGLHTRIQLEKIELSQPSVTRFAARVVLAWPSGKDFVGAAEGDDSPQGHLRCAAEATAQALELSTHRKMDLVVLANRAIKELDTVLAVVELSSRVPSLKERLVGSCLMKSYPCRGAALAVLSATNRLLPLIARGADRLS
jgi:hypothetical protein